MTSTISTSSTLFTCAATKLGRNVQPATPNNAIRTNAAFSAVIRDPCVFDTKHRPSLERRSSTSWMGSYRDSWSSFEILRQTLTSNRETHGLGWQPYLNGFGSTGQQIGRAHVCTPVTN